MKTTKTVLSLLLISLLLGNSPVSFAQQKADATKAKSPALDLARQLNQAFIEVAERVSPAVVVITVTQKASASSMGEEADSLFEMLPPELRRYFEEQRRRGGNDERNPAQPRRRTPTGRGSGVVITEDGYILTNNHVVEEAEKITVRFKDGKDYVAEVRGVDPSSDLAVLKIKDAKGLISARLGDSSAARVGEFVLAIGAPFFLDYSVTVGHISAKGRALPEIAAVLGPYADQDFIQTDASINPGNSGGPLVNLYGEVIAINTMIRGIGTGIGFAVPSNLAKEVSDRLIKDGKFTRSRIGIEIRDLRGDQELQAEFPSLGDGVVVVGISADGPAAKSELRAGDVVTAVNGKTVKTSRDLKEHVAYTKPGEAVTLDVMRSEAKGKTRAVSVKVKTEAIPEADNTVAARGGGGSSAEAADAFGLTVKGLTSDLADEYGVDERQGVIVTGVQPGSLAEEKGIRPGDVITEVNREAVANLRQYRDAVKTADKKKGVIVNYLSKGTSRFTVLKEEE